MNSKIRRINLFAGPGTGKSTTAAWLFSEIKSLYRGKIKVELVQEVIKDWAYEGKKLTGFDQFYCFAQQLHREEFLLKNGVDIVITDSPLWLNTMYAEDNDTLGNREQVFMCQIFDEQYPSTNIILERTIKEYETHGRFHSLEEAKKLDQEIKDYINYNEHIIGCAHLADYGNKDHVLGIFKDYVLPHYGKN